MSEPVTAPIRILLLVSNPLDAPLNIDRDLAAGGGR
jgi:hypothetical protein